jgi:hypothetical protein
MRIFERIFEDLRYALRSPRRRPSFTPVAIDSMAVALGASTMAFSFARARGQDAALPGRGPARDSSPT